MPFIGCHNWIKENGISWIQKHEISGILKYYISGKESQQHLSLKRREFGKDETDGQSIILNISKTSKIFISSQLLSFISDGWMFTSTVRTQRATTLMLSRPRIASCSSAANWRLAALSIKIYISRSTYNTTHIELDSWLAPLQTKPIQSSIPPRWSERPDIILVILIYYNIMRHLMICGIAWF